IKGDGIVDGPTNRNGFWHSTCYAKLLETQGLWCCQTCLPFVCRGLLSRRTGFTRSVVQGPSVVGRYLEMRPVATCLARVRPSSSAWIVIPRFDLWCSSTRGTTGACRIRDCVSAGHRHGGYLGPHYRSQHGQRDLRRGAREI